MDYSFPQQQLLKPAVCSPRGSLDHQFSGSQDPLAPASPKPSLARVALRNMHRHSDNGSDQGSPPPSAMRPKPMLRMETSPLVTSAFSPDADGVASQRRVSFSREAILGIDRSSLPGFNVAAISPSGRCLDCTEMAPGTPPNGFLTEHLSLLDYKGLGSNLINQSNNENLLSADPFCEEQENAPPRASGSPRFLKCQSMPARQHRRSSNADSLPALAAVHEMHEADMHLPTDDVWPDMLPVSRKLVRRRSSLCDSSAASPELPNADTTSDLPVLADNPFREDDEVDASPFLLPSTEQGRSFMQCKSMPVRRSWVPSAGDVHPVVEVVREECLYETALLEDSWPKGPPPHCLRKMQRRRSSLSSTFSDGSTGVQTPPSFCEPVARQGDIDPFAEDEDEALPAVRPSMNFNQRSFNKSVSLPARGRRATFSGEAHAAVEALKEQSRHERDPDMDMWLAALPIARQASRHRRSSLGGDFLVPASGGAEEWSSMPALSASMLMGHEEEEPERTESRAAFGRGLSRMRSLSGYNKPDSVPENDLPHVPQLGRTSQHRRSSLSSCAGTPRAVQVHSALTAPQLDNPFEEEEDTDSRFQSLAFRSTPFMGRCQSMPLRGRRATFSGEMHSAVEIVKRVVRAEQAPAEDFWPTFAQPPNRQPSTRRRSSLAGGSNVNPLPSALAPLDGSPPASFVFAAPTAPASGSPRERDGHIFYATPPAKTGGPPAAVSTKSTRHRRATVSGEYCTNFPSISEAPDEDVPELAGMDTGHSACTMPPISD